MTSSTRVVTIICWPVLCFFSLLLSQQLYAEKLKNTEVQQSLLEYARQCETLIGQIPVFDCRDGTIVPITVNGNPPESFPVDSCDKPAMLEYKGLEASAQCSPYSRIHHLSFAAVQISVFCPRKYLMPVNDPFHAETDIN